MTTQISGDTGVSQCQPGSVSQDDLAANVVGKGPAFSASQTTAQTFTQVVDTKVLFQQVDFDTNNNFANSRFTPTVPGYYEVSATVYIVTLATQVHGVNLQLWKNGAVARKSPNASSVGAALGVNGNWLIYMNGTTDYLEIYLLQNLATSTSTNAARPDLTFFQGYLVRAA